MSLYLILLFCLNMILLYFWYQIAYRNVNNEEQWVAVVSGLLVCIEQYIIVQYNKTIQYHAFWCEVSKSWFCNIIWNYVFSVC